MAVLAFAAVGAAAGWAIGGTAIAFMGMSYMGIGWTVGSLIGQAVLPGPKLPMSIGPQLGDLKIQVSTYGASIPRLYGTARLAGNVIWNPDIIQTANVQTVRSGGKGGGGSTQTQVTYSYTANFAIALCEGPIAGVRKIWANGKLYSNVGDDASPQTVLASYIGFQVYLGDETQTADPTMEAALGVGNVSGYRGTAYIVFSNVNLAEFGNRIPNLEFEVVKLGSSDPTATNLFKGATANDTITYTFDTGGLGRPMSGEVWAEYYDGTINYALLLSVADGVELARIPQPHGQNLTTHVNMAIDEDGNSYQCIGNLGDPVYRFNRSGYLEYILTASGTGHYGLAFDSDENLWGISQTGTVPRKLTSINWAAHTCTESVSGNNTFNRFCTNPGAVAGRIYGMTPTGIGYANTTTGVVTTVVVISVPNPAGNRPVIGQDGNIYFGNTTTTIRKYSSDGVLLATLTIVNASGYDLVAVMQDSNGYLWAQVHSPTLGDWLKIDVSTMTVVDSIPAVNYQWIVGETVNGDPAFWGQVAPAGAYGKVGFVPGPDLTSSTIPTLASIVSDLCLQSNLVAGDIDVTDLAAIDVEGYIISARGTIRSALEPLMGAYLVDAVESDDKIKFVRRGVASAVTIPENDLGAFEGAVNGDEQPDPIVITRQQETELPIEINIAYLSKENNYLPLSQASKRSTRNSQQKITVQFPIVMSDDYARQLAEKAMYSAWIGRTGGEFSTTRKYAKYDPTDVLSVTTSAGTRDFRVMQRDEGANGVINWMGTIEDISVYTQSATGGMPEIPAVVDIPTIGPSLFLPLDGPLLRLVDDDFGFYWGVAGTGDGWRGSQLYRSADVSNYEAMTNGIVLESTPSGYASTALGTTGITATTNEKVDEINSFTVVLREDQTLESITYGDFLAGGNAFMVGFELVQAMVCTLLAANTYVCTRLLRGRLGTEWAMGLHFIGERFMVLNDALRTLPGSANEVNVEYLYKPVTVGKTLGLTNPTAFTNTGIRKKPLSPVHLAGGRNANLDLIIKWVRRTRDPEISWNTTVDPQLLETAEQYAVDILRANGTIARTIQVTTQTATYLVADQTTDFGSAQASVSVSACQISPEYGRGYATTGTL